MITIRSLVSTGRRMMPALKQLSASEIKALASFILENKKEQTEKFIAPVRSEDPWYKSSLFCYRL